MLRRQPARAMHTLVLAALLVVTTLATTASDTAAAGDSDDRSLVSSAQLLERPFRSLVLVTVGDRVVCTGFIVAPTKVVTAGHCLARDAAGGDYRLRKGLPGNVRLYRAYSQVIGSAASPCAVSRAWAHPRFIRRDTADKTYGSRAHDYAVLTTSPDCPYSSRTVMRLWPTRAADGQLPSGSVIRLGGYPADSRFADMNGLNLWRSRGQVLAPSEDASILETTGFVAQGMSGSPVWRSFGAESPCGRAQCVVGILTECAVNDSGQCRLGDTRRLAVRVTPTVRETLLSR